MRAGTLYYRMFEAPHCRRVRLGRWEWSITDSLTGPQLVSGTALTEWGCLRRIDRALKRCRPEQERLDAICARLLAEAGLSIVASYDERHRVCVRATCQCEDRDHRRVMLAFLAIAASVRWTGAR